MKTISALLIIFTALTFPCSSCTEKNDILEIPPKEIKGCTDPNSYNYNPNATIHDDSCIPIIIGCMDPYAANYNPEANQEDGNCLSFIGEWDITSFNATGFDIILVGAIGHLTFTGNSNAVKLKLDYQDSSYKGSGNWTINRSEKKIIIAWDVNTISDAYFFCQAIDEFSYDFHETNRVTLEENCALLKLKAM